MPYIENASGLEVSYIEIGIGMYSIFIEEENNSFT
jgi:hypothetical protein